MDDRKQAFLWILAVAKFLFPFLIIHPSYELHRDEFLYLAEARHLDWGYLEAPPILSLLAWISGLFGNSEFWVRFWPALAGALTFVVSGKICLRLGGKSFALLILFLSFIFSAYLRVHFLFQPNILDVFFWTLAAWWIFCYIRQQESKFIYLLGITIGLGFLSKYSISVFALGLAAALLLSPQRKIFSGKHLYLAALAGLLIFLPNLIWQYSHNFPIINHMEELHETQLQYLSPLSFFSGQLLMTLPCFFIWLSGLWYVFFDPKGRNYIVFGWTYLLVIILLILFKGKSYYALGIYPVLLALGAFQLEKISISRTWIRYACITVIFFTGIPLLPVLLPVWDPSRLARYYKATGFDKTGILKWEDLKDHPLPQDFADMMGRRELTRKTIEAYGHIPAAGRKSTIIYGSNYGLAGALNYYGRAAGLPEAISGSASFLLWIPEYRELKHLLWISKEDPAGVETLREFEKITLLDSITNPFAREHGTRIWWLQQASPAAVQLLNAEVQKMQKRFQIKPSSAKLK